MILTFLNPMMHFYNCSYLTMDVSGTRRLEVNVKILFLEEIWRIRLCEKEAYHQKSFEKKSLH